MLVKVRKIHNLTHRYDVLNLGSSQGTLWLWELDVPDLSDLTIYQPQQLSQYGTSSRAGRSKEAKICEAFLAAPPLASSGVVEWPE